MALTKKDVEYVAKLARLELTEEEKDKYTQQLAAILEYAQKLNALDTSQVQPTAHVLPMKNVWREDQLKPSLPVDKVLANAPDPAKNCFRVPKILEG